MRKILVLVAVLYSAAAIAQTSEPPKVGDRPLVQVKPKASKAAPKGAATESAEPAAKGSAKGPATSAKAASGKPKSMAARLQACLDIDDGTKDRLNCYDGVVPPKPNPKAKAPVKAVIECGGFKDEEERLTCFNGFVERLPKLPS